mmetsp:Transcript_2965/g.12024  ORF Transcript_2965/g.12024 Transcript_2965/m.12024 type:complete len:166 (+) Transcript_2965:228-725(+)|eukprot:scaffold7362_cov266-Pinguiococcus_pyrenoidosus.AAC.31
MSIIRGRKIIRICTEIRIAATVESVWELMTRLDRYPQWNPFITQATADGDPRVVGTLMQFQLKNSDASTWRSTERVAIARHPELDTATGRKTAEWMYTYEGWPRKLRLLGTRRKQELREVEDGRVLYISEIIFMGIARRFVPLDRVLDGFVRQAEALKAEVERAA